MNIIKLNEDFNLFLQEYNPEIKNIYWERKSRFFYDFWRDKIENKDHDLLKEEIDEIVRIIDDKALGHKKEEEAIAKTGVRQPFWIRAFSTFKNDEKLRSAFSAILYAKDDENIASLIDNLLELNKNYRNGINGREKGMINSFLFLINPKKFISVVSLNHRRLISEYFEIENISPDLSPGEKIIKSNQLILDFFRKKLGNDLSPRTISEFLYLPFGDYNQDLKIKELWYEKNDKKIRTKKENKKNKDVDSNEVYSELKLKELKELQKPKNPNQDGKERKFPNNFLDQQKKNYEIGSEGERFVLDKEEARLKKVNMEHKVENMSEYMVGYDILSWNEKEKSKMYIEVKSTSAKKLKHFYITKNEIEASKKYGNNYYLYIVTDVFKNQKIKVLRNPNFLDNNKFRVANEIYDIELDY